MSPFYEGEHRLGIGDVRHLKTGPKRARVEVVDDDRLLIVPESGGFIYVGEVDIKRKEFKDRPRTIESSTMIARESASSQIARPQIIWRKK